MSWWGDFTLYFWNIKAHAVFEDELLKYLLVLLLLLFVIIIIILLFYLLFYHYFIIFDDVEYLTTRRIYLWF